MSCACPSSKVALQGAVCGVVVFLVSAVGSAWAGQRECKRDVVASSALGECAVCEKPSRADATRHVQVICEIGKAVGAEGLVAGQIVDIKSEGMSKSEARTCRVLCESYHASCQCYRTA